MFLTDGGGLGFGSSADYDNVTNRLSAALRFTGISIPAGGPCVIASNTRRSEPRRRQQRAYCTWSTRDPSGCEHNQPRQTPQHDCKRAKDNKHVRLS